MLPAPAHLSGRSHCERNQCESKRTIKISIYRYSDMNKLKYLLLGCYEEYKYSRYYSKQLFWFVVMAIIMAILYLL